MAKAAKKKRSKKYDPKLKISGSFEDVIKVSVSQMKKYLIVESESGNTPKSIREFKSTAENAPFEFAYQMLGNTHSKRTSGDKPGYYLRKDYPNNEKLKEYYPLSFGSILIGSKTLGYSEKI